MSEPSVTSSARLERRHALGTLLKARGDALVVAGLGSPVWDLAALDHRAENFYVWGGMGGTVAIGLGLAIAQPDRPVWVVTGDGEMLMGVGSLASVAMQQPSNLSILCFDNEHYVETGGQRSHTGSGVDLSAMAAGAGLKDAVTVTDDEGLTALAGTLANGVAYGAASGPIFATVKVTSDSPPRVQPPRDGAFLKTRFRQAVLGNRAALHPS